MDSLANVCFSSFAPVNERSSQSEEKGYGKIKIPLCEIWRSMEALERDRDAKKRKKKHFRFGIIFLLNDKAAHLYGNLKEIKKACLVGVLSIVAVVLHFIFLQVLFKMGRQKTFQRKKEWSITGIFLLTSCVAQIFYILLVAPGEITFLITQEWKFGLLSCKLFKSMKDVTSGIELE
ncbi:unnamed protein product [Oikopleura dioica]|uniref:G-protein coupled receptors family 1 profile domain-containing protein n=1 Tax=Oikopleura dioica TaxID=34765 RepID=E4WTK2_OIKDI|nr:unnamed protein product [Oikopleura dioica]